MKLTDIPPHITEIDPPWFFHKVHDGEFQEKIIPICHLNYYDGPLSGLFKYNDKYFYCKSVYDDERTYWASWELTEEETKIELDRHELFCKYVGTHNSYYLNSEGDYVRNIGATKPQETWDLFYKNKELPELNIKEIESRDIFGILLNPFRSW